MPAPYTESFQQVEQRGTRFRYYQGGIEAERDFYVRPFWSAPTFIAEALGTGVGWLPGVLATRKAPRAHPALEGLYAVDASVEMVHPEAVSKRNPFDGVAADVPFDPIRALNTPERCEGGAFVRIVYRPVNEVDVTYEYAARSITFAPASFVMPAPDFQQIPVDNEGILITKVVPTLDYIHKKHFCATIPKDSISKLLGRVNYDDFDIKVYKLAQFGNIPLGANPIRTETWKREMLRLDGAFIGQQVSTLGKTYYEITYRFAVCATFDNIGGTYGSPNADTDDGSKNAINVSSADRVFVGWNRIFQPSRGVYVRPRYLAGGTRFIYQLDNDITETVNGDSVSGFNLLFTEGAP